MKKSPSSISKSQPPCNANQPPGSNEKTGKEAKMGTELTQATTTKGILSFVVIRRRSLVRGKTYALLPGAGDTSSGPYSDALRGWAGGGASCTLSARLIFGDCLNCGAGSGVRKARASG